MPRSAPPPETWTSVARAARAIANPLQRILAVEAASGIALLAVTVVALVWANLWSPSYAALWHTPFGIEVGAVSFVRPLHFWINDGLMTIFFFVVGLEIRREIYEGELAGIRKAAVPVAAAIGGMLVPALIFLAFNAGRPTAVGWAIPIATDIAFAVGVLTVLGSRVPITLRVLLLALAVIDDIGAIVVIAAFYTDGIAMQWLAVAAGGLAVVFLMRGGGIRSPVVFVVPGVIVWLGFSLAGIHPTIAGVILGLATPVRHWFGPSGFAETTRAHLDQLDGQHRDALLASLDTIEHARREAVSPVERLIHLLHPWVAFGVMPVFALANAGVVIGDADIGGDSWWLFVGIVAGLAVGKPLGIVIASLGAARLGIAESATGSSRNGIVLVGLVGGIGFTMSLFIAQLAFPPGPFLDASKLAILVGSGIAIASGLAFGLARGRS